jgi:hypothetical protein
MDPRQINDGSIDVATPFSDGGSFTQHIQRRRHRVVHQFVEQLHRSVMAKRIPQTKGPFKFFCGWIYTATTSDLAIFQAQVRATMCTTQFSPHQVQRTRIIAPCDLFVDTIYIYMNSIVPQQR